MTADTKYIYYYKWVLNMLIFLLCKQFLNALDFSYLCKILCVENVPMRVVAQAGVHRKPNQRMTEFSPKEEW